MRKFNSETYFNLIPDKKSGDFIAQPTKEGTELVTQYLNNKYQANIACPIGGYSLLDMVDNDSDLYLKPKTHLVNITEMGKIISLISEARKKPDDHRQAFIFEAEQGHAVFMVYIRERGKEGILYSDSIGSDKNIALAINKNTGIQVYYTPPKRQADHASCYTDSLVFGRDTTGVSPETGQYIISDLLGLLEERGDNITKGISSVTLPNVLLKTAQLSTFISLNKDEKKLQKIIHKDETLEEFRERYGKNLSMSDGATKRISTYLHAKGNKYTANMEIQFYLNEMEKNIGHDLPKTIKTDFITHAKKAIETKEDLYYFSEQFLNKLLGYENSSLPMVEVNASQHTKAKQDNNLGIEALANKYNLSPGEFSNYLNELTEQFDKAFLSKRGNGISYSRNKAYSKEQEAVLSGLLAYPHGLACTEFLLQTRPKAFTGLLCIELVHRAITPPLKNFNPYNDASEATPVGNFNPRYANLIIDNETIIKQLHSAHELYVYGQKDAYLSARLLADYPDLLDESEKTALQWVVDNRSESSSFSDEILRLQATKDPGVTTASPDITELLKPVPAVAALIHAQKILKESVIEERKRQSGPKSVDAIENTPDEISKNKQMPQ